MFIYVDDPIVRCYEHGQSNPTYFVRYANMNMVLRKKPVSIDIIFRASLGDLFTYKINHLSNLFNKVNN